MAGKITDYPTMTTLASGDLMDVSDYDGVSAFTSKSLDWDDLKTNIESQITFTNLYTNDGTLAGNRIVSMGVNDLTYGSTGDANLLKFETTNDRIGIGTATPTEKLEVAGNAKVNGTFKTQSTSAIPLNLYKEAVGNNMIQLSMQNDAAAEYQFAQVGGSVIDDTAGSEEGAFLVQLSNNGAINSDGVHKFLINGLHQFPESINGGIFRESNSGGFRWSLNLRNSANVIEPYAALATEVIDNTNGSEDGVLKFYARSNGVNFNSSNHQAILTGTGLGIGTATPTEKLEVVGNAKITGGIDVDSSTFLVDGTTHAWSLGRLATPENDVRAITIGNAANTFNSGGGSRSIAIGYQSSAVATLATSNIAIGYQAKAPSGDNVISIGDQSGGTITSNGNQTILMGYLAGNQSVTIGTQTIAIGDQTDASGVQATLLGSQAEATADSVIGIGRLAKGTALQSIAIGLKSEATATRAYVIASGSTGTVNSVADSLAVGFNEVTPRFLFSKSADSYLNGTGNVGIGTATPTEKLEVVGNVKISSDLQVAKQAFIGIADTGQSVAFDFKNVDSKVYALRMQDSAGGFLMNIRESGNTSFGTTADLGARIGVSGNAYVTGRIGIGTAAPLSKLDVEGGIAIGTAYSGSTAAPTNGAIIEGNVGIGTTTPSDKLEVVGNLNATRYKVNGVAGANFSGVVTSITVVDGIVTAVS